MATHVQKSLSLDWLFLCLFKVQSKVLFALMKTNSVVSSYRDKKSHLNESHLIHVCLCLWNLQLFYEAKCKVVYLTNIIILRITSCSYWICNLIHVCLWTFHLYLIHVCLWNLKFFYEAKCEVVYLTNIVILLIISYSYWICIFQLVLLMLGLLLCFLVIASAHLKKKKETCEKKNRLNMLKSFLSLFI